MMPVIKMSSKQAVQAMLPVMEHFYTIQGEGINTGKASYFIRLAGCDVGCIWCDVKESWSVTEHPLMEINDLVAGALRYPSRLVVITGGEPLMHNLDALCIELHAAGFKICLETSGSWPLSGQWDWICVSPKKFKAPMPEVMQYADELKVIIYNKSDFAWAEQHAATVISKCRLLLQPEYSRFDEAMPMIIDYVKSHPRWQISLQTHKVINVP